MGSYMKFEIILDNGVRFTFRSIEAVYAFADQFLKGQSFRVTPIRQ
jgi:hypothetical protein